MILEGKKGQVESRILAEPEAERHVEEQGAKQVHDVGGRIAGGVAIRLANHIVPRLELVLRDRVIRPHLHPLARLLVNLLLADFNGDFLDQGVRRCVGVRKGCACHGIFQGRKLNLKPKRS